MLDFPVGVVVLDGLVHPADDSTALRWSVSAVTNDGVDGVAEAMRREPAIAGVDASLPQRSMEATSPPGLADPRAVVVAE